MKRLTISFFCATLLLTTYFSSASASEYLDKVEKEYDLMSDRAKAKYYETKADAKEKLNEWADDSKEKFDTTKDRAKEEYYKAKVKAKETVKEITE